MSEAAKGLDSASEQNSIGPDFFGYYTREVAELLSQNGDLLPFSSNNSEFVGKAKEVPKEEDASKHDYTRNEITSTIGSGPSFCDAAGAGLSDVKKERLRAILRQSVVVLSREVDEMLDPVINMCRVKSRIRQKKSTSCYVSATCEEDAEKRPQKKLKLCSSSPSLNNLPPHASSVSCGPTRKGSRDEHIVVAVPGKGISNGCNNQCATCHNITSSNQKTGSESPRFLCNACAEQGNESLSNMEHKGLYLGSNVAAEEQKEGDDDLQILLDYGGPNVEDRIMKYSDILSTTLGGMQQKLEELLDIVMSSCRPMTLEEKCQLQRLIKKLPPKNLERVVEIIRPRNPLEKDSSEEIFVNLDDEDNATLWRLYYYVQAFENARKLLE